MKPSVKRVIWSLLLIGACESPSGVSDDGRKPGPVSPAIEQGELIVFVKLNNANLTDPVIATQLSIVVKRDADIYLGNQNNRTVTKNPVLADTIVSVAACPGGSCSGNSFFEDQWITESTTPANIGSVADANYTMQLKKGSLIISSVPFAVNHLNDAVPNNNGTFLDIGDDQTIRSSSTRTSSRQALRRLRMRIREARLIWELR